MTVEITVAPSNVTFLSMILAKILIENAERAGKALVRVAMPREGSSKCTYPVCSPQLLSAEIRFSAKYAVFASLSSMETGDNDPKYF